MKVIEQHKAFEGQVQILEHDSAMTKTTMRLGVFTPKSQAKGGLFWLSGLTCTEQNFITKAGALEHLSRENLVLVCPDTSPRGLSLTNEHDDWDFGSGASFYVDALTNGYKDHYLMEQYLMSELYPWFRDTFCLDKNIAISGHSMGGHGALTLGLKYADKFSSVSAFAPIVNPIHCPWGQKAFKGFLGNNKKIWTNYDSCELIKAGHFHRNPILISQGLEDQFLNEQLLTKNFEEICNQHDQPLQLNY